MLYIILVYTLYLYSLCVFISFLMVGNKKIHFILVAQKKLLETRTRCCPDTETDTDTAYSVLHIQLEGIGIRIVHLIILNNTSLNNAASSLSFSACCLAFTRPSRDQSHRSVPVAMNWDRRLKREKTKREKETKRHRGNSACCSYFHFRFCLQFIMPDEF